MNCTHTGQHCPHAARCTLNADDQKSEACMNKVNRPNINSLTCTSCYKHGKQSCRFVCFRDVEEGRERSTYAVLVANGDIAKFRESQENTPYKRMKRSGELAAFATANLAKHGRLPVAQVELDGLQADGLATGNAGESEIAVDTDAQRGV